VARNRKRAKERRARRPQGASVSGSAARLEAPDPIGHAAPDVELAEAQLAVGRPELADGQSNDAEPVDELSGDEDLVDAEEEPGADEEEEPGADEEFGAGPQIPGVLPGPTSIESGQVERVQAQVAEARPRGGNRLVNFLQGSWRELQRVQWPDRRQVMQATGVVIGFVIIAGVFLGVADFLSTKVMNYILTGHFK
jgi:preprotein translocase subunit SecE